MTTANEDVSFVPSASLDSRTNPMEVEEPLLETSKQPDEVIKTEFVQSLVNRTITSGVPQSAEKKHEQVITSPPLPKKVEKPKTVNRLFPVGLLKQEVFYQALLAEYLGTLILTLICTSTGLPIASASVPDLHGALASGFIVATLVVGFGHASGAHINPAVTISFLAAFKINIIRAVGYIVMQLLGAISASALLRLLLPSHTISRLGATTVTKGVSISQAFTVEVIITFILCYTVHAICDKKRNDIGGSKALAVGLAVSVGCLFGGPYTGGSMNPARSFGPAVISSTWEHHWIYWLGPFVGAILAALIYTRALRKPAPVVPSAERVKLDRLDNL